MLRQKGLIGVSLILLIVQSASYKWQPNNFGRESVCDSEECTKRGNLYKSNMDDNVNPCQDFYSFSCGNWLRSNPGPKYSADRSVLDVMSLDFNKIIRETFESYNPKTDENIYHYRAKEVYDICVKIPEYPKKGVDDIREKIAQIGRLPRPRMWEIHTKYLKLTGESAFFRTTVVGETSEGMPVLIVMEPASAYGSILHEETWKPQEKQAYTRFLFQIIKSLNLQGTDLQINDRIEKVFDFRKRLSKIILRNSKLSPERLNPMTPQQLYMWFIDNFETQTHSQDIPWIDVMGALYSKLTPQQRHTRNLIALRHKQYFIDLLKLIKSVPEEVLAFHMEIYFIERHLQFNDMMYDLLEETSTEPHSFLRYIRERYHPRWDTCIEDHNLKEVLEHMLSANTKKYPKEEQEEQQRKINQLIGAIKLAIYDKIRNVKWIDQSTRTMTLEKLNEVQAWIGFPPWVSGTGDRKPRNIREILKPNAMLSMKDKYLYITAALLLSPIYSKDVPPIYNYAGLGTTIGHELYHVIDNCGNYPIGDGNTIDWWPEKIRKECFKKIESFVKAYNEITNREFKNHYKVVVKSNTFRTVLEDYPDVMGLEVAYNVYKDAAKKDKSVCETLPHFEKYNCDQMFYIAFANTYCGHLSKKAATQKLESAIHSIERIRINGAVAQRESFGTAFNCTVGSPMNPKKKLTLWK